MKTALANFFKKYSVNIIVGVLIAFLVLLAVPGVRADIEFGQGSGTTSEPTTLSDKLPSSSEFLDDLVSGTQDAVRSPLGTRVIAILKDLARLFVWALEQMLELFKILLSKF